MTCFEFVIEFRLGALQFFFAFQDILSSLFMSPCNEKHWSAPVIDESYKIVNTTF